MTVTRLWSFVVWIPLTLLIFAFYNVDYMYAVLFASALSCGLLVGNVNKNDDDLKKKYEELNRKFDELQRAVEDLQKH
ncbi:hypothetical protein KJ365_15910 [Glaciecola sp. XM2]|jgi:hypothetical protein|uniref:hypothetical protein n=1 Tax=Glaciecola sp. XM2 TaxID=1914931 RepID=UPI001BDEA58D|nr:hypothetical protein [Glaciecola sp. XM2]MBT1452368.1 hypothetical protein [Glaciecola sp. XM2]